MSEIIKQPAILTHSPYVGSAFDRFIHRTDIDCADAKMITPDERWYIKDIPQDGNYTLCTTCFPESVKSEPEEEVIVPLKKSKKKKPKKEK